MRNRRISTATALAVLFSSAALTGLGSTAAHADGTAVLPVASVADVVVDSVHERVFVSDRTGGKVVATDYSGNVVGTLGSLPQAGGLELSADSQTLYVAVTGSDEIAAIDTAGLTESARYSTGTADAPATLARAGGKLWFGYGTAASGNIGSLDLSGPDAVLAVAQDSRNHWYYAPRLASNPAAPGVLAAGVPGLSPSAVATYDVSGPDAPRLLAQGQAGSNLRDLAVTPDGDQVVTASGWPYKHQVLSTTDLKEVGGYPTAPYPDAVDIAADGTVAAGIDGLYQPDVYIFEPGTTEPVRKYEFADTGSGTLVPDGLAWEPDGDHLFAVTENDSTYRLNTLNAPTRAVTTVTVSAPSSVVPGKSLTVTGKISGGDPLPAGTSLTVTRTDTQSPSGKALAPVTTTEDGTFSFTDTPAVEGDAKYTVSYAGDTGHAPASTTRTVAVSRTATTLSLNNNGTVHSYDKDVSFTAHLGTTYKSRTVEIWADPYGSDKPNVLVKKATVNSSGNVSAVVDMKRDTTISAVFAGDARTAPKSVKVTAYAKVNVSTSLAKYYKTAKVSANSSTYYWYHKSTAPLFTTAMSSYPGRHYRLDIDVYVEGQWIRSYEEYFELGADGRSVLDLGTFNKAGTRVRIRSAYINDSSGDDVNSTTYSSWKYMYFTN